ncbi:transposase, IS204/IS1001/IS1096/IS1165 family protein [Alkaliphilus metalliredigens QYMF]|uniref:Transposase, IS204/IS1001/IS1096/IS1165 family protein n=1 Tax=Alkaliphilus metalliredigens (strain QYMF) TaxID=293826 RepID=A6TNF2_ALKMQ|nr:ISL3 family transposase [Alkaliphilus metalliredigens]ABR47720.1 transposase, IS204/IS1001/IS1096/IS1165 family protein [Alkaliphilus metalliredigens QYMF]
MNTNYDIIRNLIGLQGLEIIFTNVNNGIFEVFAKSAFDFAKCPQCGNVTYIVHDRRHQSYRHLPIWGMPTDIILEKKRYVCNCSPENPFDEHYSFFRRYQRYTIAFEEYVLKLAHKNTIKNASDIADVGEGTCQRIYNHYAKEALVNCTPEPLRLLGIDDIASRKGHHYDTVIYNQETGNVVAIFPGRKKEDVVAYFKSLPEDVRAGIEAVSMDMSKSYCFSVLENLPNAMPVIDRFHISQHLHNCIDEGRKHIQNHIRKYGNKDEVFKIRWGILKHIDDANYQEYNNLLDAFSKYPKLEELHYLKEEFSTFFYLTTKEDAASFLGYYKGLVEESGIPEFEKFVKTLDNWMEYILNYYDYPISNGITEGNNHKVKNIKRRAYGYRNRNNWEIRVKYEFQCA